MTHMPASLIEQRLNASLVGRYTVEREVGRGGMATVFLARDLRHDRHVALKVLEPELGALLGGERFLAEIKVTANLQHPNLLPLFDSGEADGLLFYVMPFVDGESLRARLDREQQLPVDEAVRIATAIANGLAYAHSHGVIHRDLKPENILLQAGQPVIADFGIALAVSKAGGARITQTGLSLGTPQYMSPEQATGDRGVDARSDIYSLGALTYEMLTGEPPHSGGSAQVIIAKLMTEEVRPLTLIRRTVPPHVDAAVRRSLEKLAADRFATAGEFANALNTRGTEPVLSAYATSRVQGSTGGTWRRRSPAFASWGLVAVLASILAWSQLHREKVPDTPVVRTLLDVDHGERVMVEGFPLKISPQGDRIAYVVQGPAGYRTMVRRTSDLAGREIAHNSLANFEFSPDGHWIAYTVGGEVRKMSVDGGPSLTLGKLAAARVNRINWVKPDLLLISTWNGIWRLPANGGEPKFVAGSDSVHSSTAAVMLPDGNTIIHSFSSTSDDYELRALTMSTGKSVALGIHAMAPEGFMDGCLVYLTLNGELMAVPFDPGTLHATGDPIQFEAGVTGVGFSTSGTLAFMPGQSSFRMVLAADGKEDEVLPVEPANFMNPRFSPDGRKIAVSVVGGVTNDVWVYDIAAGTFTRLTRDGQNGVPEWSPDGKQVIYRYNGGGRASDKFNRGLWTQPVDGSGPAAKLWEVTGDPINEGLISPDGKWLVYRTSPEGMHPRDIMAVPLTGEKKPMMLVGGPGSEIMPRISPDGRWLAYQADESGRFEIYVRPFPNAGSRFQVSANGGAEPLWSKSGKTLYYHTQEGIEAVDVSTTPDFAPPSSGGTPPFMATHRRPQRTANYDVAPNDSRFPGAAPSGGGIAAGDRVQLEARTARKDGEEVTSLTRFRRATSPWR